MQEFDEMEHNMKKKKKDIKINIKPFSTEIRRYEGGFDWSFYAPIAGNHRRRKIVTMKFERWWLVYLSQDLKKMLDEEKAELARLVELTGFKENN